jgi:hypothetical protein
MTRVDRLEAHAQSLRLLVTHDENLEYNSFLDSLDELIEHLQSKQDARRSAAYLKSRHASSAISVPFASAAAGESNAS